MTIDNLISFIIINAETLGVTMKQIEEVGTDKVLGQCANEQAAWDYFCDGGFDKDYDSLFM